MEATQDTQESTQPYQDPRRRGLTNSGLEDYDVSDIICILHPNSLPAHDAVAATARIGLQHILQRGEPEYGASDTTARDIALRLSASVRDLNMGFCFGRYTERCDVLLSTAEGSTRISKIHFRIYLTLDGILMLQDTSTNGTIVDNCHLQRDQHQKSRMLTNGSLIRIISSTEPQEEVRFIVRIPPREGSMVDYTQNLYNYFQRVEMHGARRRPKPHGLPPRPSVPQVLPWTMTNPYGMHWSGGSVYNITGQIGKGGFATVYKLATKQHGVVYAAKELDKRCFMKNGVLDQKVDNELKIISGLRHPNIVQYEDYHEHDRWIYIIMEYVPCGELSSYLQTHGKMPEDMVKSVARQMLHALQYLHKRKITHRDIKPENILIASLDPLRVKLSDFGLSKIAQEETFLKTFCGTYLYCAPEVYPEYENYRKGEVRKRRRIGDPPLKTSPYGQSVDMWSLAAVLFHILCGIPPFAIHQEERGIQMLRIIMTTDIDFSLLREVDVSEQGIDFLLKLLDRDPRSRPDERQCFKHPWIADVRDVDVYSDADGDDGFYDEQAKLVIIEETAEDVLDASRLSIQERGDAREEQDRGGPDSNEYRPKRQRLDEIEIRYPSLPNLDSFADANPHHPPMNRERLFGEVTESVLQSSGILGDVDGDAWKFLQVPSFDSLNSSSGESMDDGQYLAITSSPPANTMGGSAASLLGAETLVRRLKMSSSDADPSSARASPAADEQETPRSPGQKQMTPANEGLSETNQDAVNAHEMTPKVTRLSRQEDPPLPDTSSECSRDPQDTMPHGSDARARPSHDLDDEPTVRVDTRTGKELKTPYRSLSDDLQEASPVLLNARALATLEFAKPRHVLGKLTTLPGSIFDLTIRLENRMTSWGRGQQATISHPEPMDTRIPVYALEVTFWTPGIESRIDSGDDWMTIPDVMAILSTKTRRCIWVNDVELRRGPNRDGSRDGFYFGKLYTGDIITVYQHYDLYLKFRCEFYHGVSARQRPGSEKGFLVQEAPSSKIPPREDQPHKLDRSEGGKRRRGKGKDREAEAPLLA